MIIFWKRNSWSAGCEKMKTSCCSLLELARSRLKVSRMSRVSMPLPANNLSSILCSQSDLNGCGVT